MSRFILWPRALITALILAAATPLCWSAAQSPRGRSASTNAPFTLAKRAGGWSLVSPQGQPFFSVGVCVVSQGAERSVYDAENPGYAAWRHYADANAWAETTLRRLKLWRFTTLGGWSDDEALRRAKGSSLWLTPVLHIGATAGAPWWDMWDAKIVRRMEELMDTPSRFE